jgi:hypothetical protein
MDFCSPTSSALCRVTVILPTHAAKKLPAKLDITGNMTHGCVLLHTPGRYITISTLGVTLSLEPWINPRWASPESSIIQVKDFEARDLSSTSGPDGISYYVIDDRIPCRHQPRVGAGLPPLTPV